MICGHCGKRSATLQHVRFCAYVQDGIWAESLLERDLSDNAPEHLCPDCDEVGNCRWA